MRFQRNSGRHHFGSGIALAGYSSHGSGHNVAPSMPSISNTEIINIPETKLNGPKFQPKKPPLGTLNGSVDLFLMDSKQLKELEQENSSHSKQSKDLNGQGITLAGMPSRMYGCGVSKHHKKYFKIKHNFDDDVKMSSHEFMNKLLGSRHSQALRNQHYKALSKVHMGAGIVDSFKKFIPKAQAFLTKGAESVIKHAPMIEKALNTAEKIMPEKMSKVAPVIRKVLGTAMKFAPLLL